MNVRHFDVYASGNQSPSYDEVFCDDASIQVVGSSTLRITKLECLGSVNISCNSSSTIIIGELSCDSLQLYDGYSSTINLSSVTGCKNMSISVTYSSTLIINGGTIDKLTGSVQYTSTVKNLAQVAALDVWLDNPATKAPHVNILASSYYDR